MPTDREIEAAAKALMEGWDVNDDDYTFEEAAKAALQAAEQARWLPISECPSAEVVLVAIPFDEQNGGYYYHCAAYWGGKWRVAGMTTSRAPTHFQPLPTPPEGE